MKQDKRLDKTKHGDIKRKRRISILLVCVLCAVAVACLILDLDHRGAISWPGGVADAISAVCSAHGLHYDNLGLLLSSNYAVVIAVVSVIAAVFPIIVREKTEKTFGIRREDLREPDSHPSLFRGERIPYIMVFIPLLLLLSVIAGWYVVGLYLLVLTLLGMLGIFLYYLHDHSGNDAIKTVVKRFFSYTEREQGYYTDGITDYRMRLDNVGAYIDKENDWDDAHKVFRAMLLDAAERPRIQRFATVFFYVRSIYSRLCAKNENTLTYLFRIYTECMMTTIKNHTYSRDDSLTFLWAVLSAMEECATEKNIVVFLTEFQDICTRCSLQYQAAGVEKPADEIYQEDVVVIVFLECWMRHHEDCRLDDAYKAVRDIWRNAAGVLGCRDLLIQVEDDTVACFDEIYGAYSGERQAFEDVSNDMLSGRSDSVLATFLEMRGIG